LVQEITPRRAGQPPFGKRVEISDHPAIVADLVPQCSGRLAVS
jgi:hypothetical protein